MGKPNKTSRAHHRSEKKALTITCTQVKDKPHTQDCDITLHCVECEWQDRTHTFTFQSFLKMCLFHKDFHDRLLVACFLEASNAFIPRVTWFTLIQTLIVYCAFFFLT